MDHSEWAKNQRTVTVTVDGHDLTVASYHEGAGPPVVFLHGIPTWSYMWRDIVGTISSEYEVIVPDMVGYGNSAMHDGFDRSLRAQEEMLRSFLDDLGHETVSIVGHDIGGGVALRYASHNPSRVESLVLSNATAYDSWPIQSILELGVPSRMRETSVEELQTTLETAYRETLRGDDPSTEFIEGMLAQCRTKEGAISMGRNAIALNTNHTTEIDYSAITVETLLLWGADDDEQPIADAERLQEDLQRADVVGLEDANHWVTEDRPEAYRRELQAFMA